LTTPNPNEARDMLDLGTHTHTHTHTHTQARARARSLSLSLFLTQTHLRRLGHVLACQDSSVASTSSTTSAQMLISLRFRV
jgi:hypothetical protein